MVAAKNAFAIFEMLLSSDVAPLPAEAFPRLLCTATFLEFSTQGCMPESRRSKWLVDINENTFFFEILDLHLNNYYKPFINSCCFCDKDGGDELLLLLLLLLRK